MNPSKVDNKFLVTFNNQDVAPQIPLSAMSTTFQTAEGKRMKFNRKINNVKQDGPKASTIEDKKIYIYDSYNAEFQNDTSAFNINLQRMLKLDEL